MFTMYIISAFVDYSLSFPKDFPIKEWIVQQYKHSKNRLVYFLISRFFLEISYRIWSTGLKSPYTTGER